MSDELKLQQRVIDELEFEPAVNAAHIGVSVRGGVVTLTGHVESFAEKFAAERAARRVKGVTGVAQEIEVRLAEDKKTADDEIAQRAVKLLEWDVAVPSDAIAVKVEHGIVTLAGTVDWGFQRAEAEYDVRKLGGVKGVVNLIAIRPKVRAEEVRSRLNAAFERNADLEAKHLTIDVIDGKVVLAGKVASWAEREAAERAAWSVPGVTAVDDRISIARA
ncbi:MAG TPA: BON domain-containing protein [Stellaceae bacterium]|nr:BON domain-containing protein [Stellaceae bacterium]